MNAIYIIIPIVVLLCLAIIFVNPAQLFLKKLNGKNINQKKTGFQWGIPVFDKSNVKIIEHPPIVITGHNKKNTISL